MATGTLHKIGWGAVETHDITDTDSPWSATFDGIAIAILGPTTNTVGHCRIRNSSLGALAYIESWEAGKAGFAFVPIMKGSSYTYDNGANVDTLKLYCYPFK